MPSRLDHLVVLAPSLEEGAQWVQDQLGFPPGPGRQHPHMGTHNLLLSLGPATYLEIVAIDPEAPPVQRVRWFGLDDPRNAVPVRLAAWVADTSDIDADAAPELGPVETMQRDGKSWRMTSLPDGSVPLAGAAPLLIQRLVPTHPAALLPDAKLRVRRLDIRHPHPQQVRAVLARIGLAASPQVQVHAAKACTLSADIDTPHGPRTLA